MSIENDDLAELAVQYWKLSRSYQKSLSILPEKKANKARAQVRFSDGKVSSIFERLRLEIMTFDGALFSAELPVSPINADDVEGSQPVRIIQTIDPAVVLNGKVLRVARVMLEGE
ncbi:hypothetical protein [Sphingomicrobium lutaoense]|uniref:Uncharacterized protein n=1 Tax=Sphingomicrobium lutaoense TaxID=515949 RepID=A0A839Z486_9SPHN|nr:hypothetical protein [Sphingomicrobium lutaoense]MBB3763434.1 hypothetical protein [Sphingomicrobium lutaoense]